MYVCVRCLHTADNSRVGRSVCCSGVVDAAITGEREPPLCALHWSPSYAADREVSAPVSWPMTPSHLSPMSCLIFLLSRITCGSVQISTRQLAPTSTSIQRCPGRSLVT